ncbi:four helix bundle protein, partial [bacterium]|nr:four helix bundle protein [bacterium]
MDTFEKLAVWQEGRILAVEIYRSFRDCRDFSFRDQVHRAALSVPANIAEGV